MRECLRKYQRRTLMQRIMCAWANALQCVVCVFGSSDPLCGFHIVSRTAETNASSHMDVELVSSLHLYAWGSQNLSFSGSITSETSWSFHSKLQQGVSYTTTTIRSSLSRNVCFYHKRGSANITINSHLAFVYEPTVLSWTKSCNCRAVHCYVFHSFWQLSSKCSSF